MKKTLCIILAVVMTFAMAVAVFADNATIQSDGNGTSTQSVNATYKGPTTAAGEVYYVTVTWAAQEGDLTYSAGQTAYNWNGADMMYEADQVSGKGWTGTGIVEVTVTNQSNATITAKGTATNAYDLSITADKELTLTSAAVKDGKPLEVTSGEKGTEQVDKITFTINSNSSTTEWDGSDTIGTLTVTIAPVQD